MNYVLWVISGDKGALQQLIYVRTSSEGLYWPGMNVFLADVACWWRSPDCVDFKSGCGLSPCSLSICLWYFYFYKQHGPKPSIFAFTGFSFVVSNRPLEVQATLLRLHFPGDISHAHFACPWCYLDSILLSLPALGFSLKALLRLLWAFLGTLSWHVLDVLWCAPRVYYRLSLVQFIASLLLWGDHLCRDRSMALRTTRSWTSCLGQGGFLTLFATFLLEEMLRLIKTLAELSRRDILTVNIYFDCYNRCVGRRFWTNFILLLFDWQLLLVMMLLGVGGGEDVKFQFQQMAIYPAPSYFVYSLIRFH